MIFKKSTSARFIAYLTSIVLISIVGLMVGELELFPATLNIFIKGFCIALCQSILLLGCFFIKGKPNAFFISIFTLLAFYFGNTFAKLIQTPEELLFLFRTGLSIGTSLGIVILYAGAPNAVVSIGR